MTCCGGDGEVVIDKVQVAIRVRVWQKEDVVGYEWIGGEVEEGGGGIRRV